MTAPDREVFLNEVREAIEDSLRQRGIDTTALAQAAIDAMARRMGPEF